jgi:hypothetical protein
MRHPGKSHFEEEKMSRTMLAALTLLAVNDPYLPGALGHD